MIAEIDKVLGQVPFASNVRLPGMLHCRIVRSTAPHARILAIDTSAARRLPGVHAVVTGDDLTAHSQLALRYGPVLHDQPVLALDKVRYVGEPVAAVVAETVAQAEAAAAAVAIDYEELPAVYSVAEAISSGAPRLFDAPPAVDPSFVDVAVHSDVARNVCSSYRIVRGDADRAIADADHVFEHTFFSPAVQHVPLETHACVAAWSGGQLTVHSGTQTPFILRAQLAGIFGLPQTSVRVLAPPLGGGFGAKAYASIEPLAAVLAYLTGRPVRIYLLREEEFVTVTKHAMQVTLRTGVRSDGQLVARQATGYYNAGAYAGISPRKIIFGAYGINGPYNVPAVRHEMFAVYTNTPPAGAYRGFAINQCAWAYESQMDIIAAALGIDPLELRLKNLLREGDRFCTGEVMGDVHFSEVLRRVASSIGYTGRTNRVEGDTVSGIGLSCIIEGTITPTTSCALVKLNGDGSVTALTGSVEMGQGIQEALRRIVAAALGVELQSVSLADIDTDVTPYDQQTTASRSVFSMGTALERACEEIRQQLAELGARLLQPSAELAVERGRVFSPDDPGRALSYGQLVRRSGMGNLMGRGTFRTEGRLDPDTGQGIASVHWHQSAAAAEVEIDRRTGRVRVVRYRGAVHAGRLIDRVGAELQCEGGLTFGLGNALLEELVFDNGQLVNGTLTDYMIPALEDLPADCAFEILEAEGAAEPHGLGEPPLPVVAPAIGNAIADATGVRLYDLPLSAEKVLRALREPEAEAPPPPAAEVTAAGVPG
jgi:CO/xanthine dehydrogenase Mo-binding subunit